MKGYDMDEETVEGQENETMSDGDPDTSEPTVPEPAVDSPDAGDASDAPDAPAGDAGDADSGDMAAEAAEVLDVPGDPVEAAEAVGDESPDEQPEVEQASQVPAGTPSMTDRAQQRMVEGVEISRHNRHASIEHNQALRAQQQESQKR
jgi:hypothetical protein